MCVCIWGRGGGGLGGGKKPELLQDRHMLPSKITMDSCDRHCLLSVWGGQGGLTGCVCGKEGYSVKGGNSSNRRAASDIVMCGS